MLLLALFLLLIPPVWAGVETLSNRRGPGAGPPSEAAAREGQALLSRTLGTHGAAAWRARPIAEFGVHCEKLFGGSLRLLIAVAPATRAARIGVVSSGEEYRYDGATKALRVVSADSSHVESLRSLTPSLLFWSLVPFVLEDSTARVWRLPAVRRGGETRDRLVVRWPGAVDWYIFELRPADGRILAVEFRSSGTPALVRWRGEREGSTDSGGVQLPGVWRFRPAHPGLALMFGMQDVYTFRYFPASPAESPR